MLQLTKPVIGMEEVEAVKKVLLSGWLNESDVTRQFEDAFARYVGSKYAVAVCNATCGLTLALKTFVEEPLGKVVVPSFTHPATVLAVINADCKPVFADVNPETFNLEYNGDLPCIPVSWGGHPLVYMPRNILVEDAACSIGSSCDGVKTGSRYLSVFSLHPRKLITTGEGGMITTNSHETMLKLRDLKSFKRFGGGNYKLSNVASAIGLEQLKKLDKIVKTRQEQAAIYDELLKPLRYVHMPERKNNIVHTYQTYAVLLNVGVNRDKVILELANRGIEAQIGTYACHTLPLFKEMNYATLKVLNVSESLASQLLSLPMSYDLTMEDQEYVARCLNEATIKCS